MKPLSVAMAACLCLAACREQAQTHLARGNVLQNQGKTDEAVAEYEAAAKEDPNLSAPWLRLGNLFSDQGKKEQALAAYRQATARNPGQLDAWIGMARAQSEQGHDSDARASLTRALDVEPRNLYARLSRAQLALRDGDVQAALDDAKLASHQDDKDLSGLYVYGAAMAAAKDYTGAAAAFDRLASLDAASPFAAYGRARLLLAQGDRAGAIRQLEMVVGLEPKQREAIAADAVFGALHGDAQFDKDFGVADGGLTRPAPRPSDGG
jgi:cytochrome c-type biogenesis protein CcmH/NrfG